MTSKLSNIVHKSVTAFNALSLEERIAYIEWQRKSWVVREIMLEHEDISRETAEALYEKERSL